MAIPYKQPPRLTGVSKPPPDAVRRFIPPPGSHLVVNGIPDTQEMVERSFNPQAKLAFEEALRLSRLLRKEGS